MSKDTSCVHIVCPGQCASHEHVTLPNNPHRSTSFAPGENDARLCDTALVSGKYHDRMMHVSVILLLLVVSTMIE